MNSISYMGFIAFLFAILPCQSHESSEDVYLRMISNGIQAAMEEYHAEDWKKTSQTASKFWADPTSALDQEVKKQHGKFHRYLLRAFLGDTASIKKIMKHNFEYQLECLIADYDKAPVSRYQFWNKIPSQYHATLAYEFLAVESGIKLDRNYHSVFSLASERARLIEEETLKIKSQEQHAAPSAPPPPPAPPVLSLVPPAAQSPSFKLKHPTKNRALKPGKKQNQQFTSDDILTSRSSLKKTTTRTGSSSLSKTVLDEIRQGGFNLKSATQRILKDLPQAQQDQDLLAILQRRFAIIRPGIAGENG